MRIIALFWALLASMWTASVWSHTSRIDSYISHGTGGDKEAFTKLYKTLTTDHSVRALSLKVEWGRCVIDPRDPFAFSFVKGDRFPPLKEIILDGYQFDDENGIYRERGRRYESGIYGIRYHLAEEYGYEWLRPTPLPKVGEPPFEVVNGANLELWKKAMDWSQVETLELTNVALGTFMKHMSGELPHLKRLKLGPHWSLADGDMLTLADDITSFLPTLAALESLSLPLTIGKIFVAQNSNLHTFDSGRTQPLNGQDVFNITVAQTFLHDKYLEWIFCR